MKSEKPPFAVEGEHPGAWVMQLKLSFLLTVKVHAAEFDSAAEI